MKNTWGSPRIVVEQFAPNEYVAACFQLACNVWQPGGSDEIPTYDGHGANRVENNTHSANACGSAANQYITDNNGTITVREYSSDQGWLDCEILSPTSGTISVGDYVSWNTYSGDGKRTWHHHGVASAADSSHPNRS